MLGGAKHVGGGARMKLGGGAHPPRKSASANATVTSYRRKTNLIT